MIMIAQHGQLYTQRVIRSAAVRMNENSKKNVSNSALQRSTLSPWPAATSFFGCCMLLLKDFLPVTCPWNKQNIIDFLVFLTWTWVLVLRIWSIVGSIHWRMSGYSAGDFWPTTGIGNGKPSSVSAKRFQVLLFGASSAIPSPSWYMVRFVGKQQDK